MKEKVFTLEAIDPVDIFGVNECNLELMRELQQQATEMQGLLSTSLKQPSGARNGGLNHGKRSAPKLVA